MILRSDKFDDIYFSLEGGLDETHHVFLQGNNLPLAWVGKDKFTIFETGFGTGLNFLCAWKLFEETAQPDQRLHFISIEKYPLSKSEIRQALEVWREQLGEYSDRYLSVYPLRVPGPHQIHITDRVTLTLWIGDISDILPNIAGDTIDAWFLDGFTPSKNPDMWEDILYETMARLSHSQTSFASFTSAGFVRRGLEAAGFKVEKSKGFGRKREMIKGIFTQGKIISINKSKLKIAIIGGGLAGCAMAYLAKKNGLEAVIYEAGSNLAHGASGGRLGMINPKLTAKPTPQSDYYTAAYANALRILSDIPDIDFAVHGSLHIASDEDMKRRIKGYIENLGWHSDHIMMRGDDLYYPDGASVCPQKLCGKLAEDTEVRLNHLITNLSDIDADVIILASGYKVLELLSDDLPIHSVRGQVSWVKPQSKIDENICFGGYITPRVTEGFHILGSSFQPWQTDTDLNDKDHQENINRYNSVLNKNIDMSDVIGGWSALRTSSKDRFPVVGQIDDKTFISTAHGSHGIISSLMAAEILISMIIDCMIPASQDVLKALYPKRFHKR